MLESQQGIVLHATDTEGAKHAFRFRFWANAQARSATPMGLWVYGEGVWPLTSPCRYSYGRCR